jgi:hypothetical protein
MRVHSLRTLVHHEIYFPSRSSQLFLFVAMLLSALFFSVTQTAKACSCGPRPTVLDAFERAEEVVIVRVLSVEKAEDREKRSYAEGVKSATLIVDKVFKGKLQTRDEIVFGQGGGADCIWTFDEQSVGHQYLFYLARPETFTKSERRYLPSREPGLWFAFGCGRSTGLANATEDLLYLENMRKRRGQTRISGSIGGGFEYPDMDVEGKKIKIIGEKKTYETKTDKNGVFEIYDLPPGKYSIEPEMSAGWKINPYWLRYSTSIVGGEFEQPEKKSLKQIQILLEPKKHATVNIVFDVDNFVRGRVLGPKGRPLSGVCVYLWPPGAESWGSFDCTDEQGRFEITSVPKGEYVLVANRDGKLSSREPFRQIFYPGVSERERAAVISIRPGETIENLDIVIPALEEMITIEGVLHYSDGKPVADEWVKFKATKKDEKVDGDVSERTDRNGKFRLQVLKGLRGEVFGEDWLTTGLYRDCPKVDELIAKSGQKNLTVLTNIVTLTTEQDVYEVELTLPFPRCKRAKE